MGLSRREFLKRVGLCGAGLAALPLAGRLAGSTGRAAAAADGGHPAAQWVMVIDLRKCDGCEGLGKPPQCTAACRQGHFVPEDQEWIKVAKVKGEGGSSYWMMFPCMQCQRAPCVVVCPVGASYYDPSGVVLIDHRRCIGCRLCMAACPYQRRYFNWKQQEVPPAAALASYSPEYPVPAAKGTVSKCMFCLHNAAMGKLPICIYGCPRGALYFGDAERDVVTNGLEAVCLSKFLSENSAFRYKEELGTEPRVYYLPGYGQQSGREARE